ncbi:glycosylhydrolase-like jelly roll fold domain-containing protein [Paenibacillus sp. FSL H7-0331]|uniref:glycosylhydrolase-like jelly roll fold domain-containing protein n=1 Tax=Paenibacillus sp. FSL H7-0331 TaxID=1920421 RepID=UPI00096DF3E6|nr:glycosylhydrolase-like jelly roll fold domain-containing protein [Paenibacillus sp. FSL H7-0331]OME97851.1 glycosyl transferase family 2 [Paenibacillus sp. FSL H7-0331]
MGNRLKEVLEGQEHNYILPFLWQHGEEEKVIREEMVRVHEAGIGAICVEARPHPDFLGPKWWADMDIIMEEARNRGMKVWLLDDDHFPTGNAAGKVKEAPEELHRKFLGERYIDTLGPAQGTSLLLDTLLMRGLRPTISQPQNASGKNKLISVVAVRRDPSNGTLLSECTDITDLVQDGILYWDIPEGYWRVFIISENKDGGSQQQEDYLNPLDRDSVRILLDTVYEAVYERYKADFGKTFAGFFSDEPGFYNDKTTFDFNSKPGKKGVPLPWSSEMSDLLEQALGGDYRKYLPLLWHDAGEQTNIVRYTYMNIVSKLYADNFCSQIGEWCRTRGVEYIGHVLEDNNVHARLGSGAGHFFRSMWGQDMSGLDVVLWQIVPGFDELSFSKPGGDTDSEFFHYGLAKLGVSLGHIDPKKQGRTMCEVYGAYGWAEGLKLMKWITDHMLVRGVNYFVPHSFTQKAFPDPDCPPHMYASGKNPQYRYYKYLNGYMNRMCHLISGGRHVATAAVIYHAEAEWSGDSMYFHKPVKELMQHQIDCDVLPVDILLDAANVKDGKLQVNIEAYECLVVPYAEALPTAMVRRLAQLAEQGLAVRFINELPSRSSEGKDVSAELSLLANHRHVKVVPLDKLSQELIADGYYDIRLAKNEPYLRHYHYLHDGLDVFMFFNEHPHQTIKTKMDLPVQGNVYAYDAFLNRLTKLDVNGDTDVTEVQLVIHPYESVVLLHGADLEGYDTLPPYTLGSDLELKGEWTVSTTQSEQYPRFREWGKLATLTNMSRPDCLPRFTGTFRYETDFEWSESSSRVLLELGEVYETAEVWLNGEHVGVRICPPYCLEINGLIKKGINKLVIEVTNTLVKDQRDFLSSFAQQEPSGLIGPVQVTSIK